MLSYWHYRAGRFHQDQGMRIDLVLAGADPAGRVASAWIDRKPARVRAPATTRR